jgi:hypothetical protein
VKADREGEDVDESDLAQPAAITKSKPSIPALQPTRYDDVWTRPFKRTLLSDGPYANNLAFEVPTPHRQTRTMGQWTLGDAPGKESEGRVFLASNSNITL